MTEHTIYWTKVIHQKWSFHIASTAKGCCYVGSQNQSLAELSKWAERRFPGSSLIEDNETLQPFAVELIEYLQGKRKIFTVPFDYDGTPFQIAVWNALGEIPYGQTQSYSDIAIRIQKPAAVRAVGAAIKGQSSLDDRTLSSSCWKKWVPNRLQRTAWT